MNRVTTNEQHNSHRRYAMNVYYKAMILAGAIVAFAWFIRMNEIKEQPNKVELAMKQLHSGSEVVAEMDAENLFRSNRFMVGCLVLAGLGLAMFGSEFRRWLRPRVR